MTAMSNPSRHALRHVFAFVLALAAGPAMAGAWTPVGPADGGTLLPYLAQENASIATHPAKGEQAMIAAGFVPDGGTATYFTGDGGGHWSSNARPGALGVPHLAGDPVTAFLAEPGRLLRSPDFGRTWAPLPLPASAPEAPFLLGSVNPGNAAEMLGSAGATVWHTVDGGASWMPDAAPAVVSAMAVDWSTRRLFVSFRSNPSIGNRPIDSPGAWGIGGNDPQAFAAGHGVVLSRSGAGTLSRSTDGGATFVPVGQTLGATSVCGFAFAALPSARVYAIECDSGRILRSDDDGATWSVASTIAPVPIGSPAVDAASPDRLYVMTSRGTVLSEDGALTFAPLARSTGAPGYARAIFFDVTTAARQWLSRGESAPASILRSDDAGATWVEVDADHRVLGASRSRANTLVGTRTGDQGLWLSTDGGGSWIEKAPYFGSRGATVGPMTYGQGPGEIFVAAISLGLGNSVSKDLFTSNDDGDSFTERFAPPIRVNALAATQVGPAMLYAGGPPEAPGAPQLYRSTDTALTWQPVATFPATTAWADAANGNTVTAIAIDPAEPSRVYVGFEHPDYVMRSVDGGATWTRATIGLGAGKITSLVVDPADPSTLYASQLGSGVFRSTDRGATWSAMDEGMHDDLALGVKVDAHQPGRIFAETGSGLYRVDLGSGVPAGDRRAIEFHHQAFDHYFVSADTDEVAGLDAGVFEGWSRTGEGFRVADANDPGNLPVCRFFGRFPPQSTHFYTPYPHECEGLTADPNWIFEKIAFGLALPTAPPQRGCPPGTRALRRFYNDFMGGAPNHRYSTSPITYDVMTGQGWIYEGEAGTLVFACVPY